MHIQICQLICKTAKLKSDQTIHFTAKKKDYTRPFAMHATQLVMLVVVRFHMVMLLGVRFAAANLNIYLSPPETMRLLGEYK